MIKKRKEMIIIMITSKQEFLEYLKADLTSYGGGIYKKPSLLQRIFSKPIRFIYTLRKCEFYKNTNHPLAKLYLIKLRFLEEKMGYTIPINVLGKGSIIVHLGTVIINPAAKIGEYCRIHAGVNIGTSAGAKRSAPIIGNYVYIGPGAKLFGNIFIANRCAIGANSVVNKNFLEEGKTIAGIPAKVVSNKGSNGLL